MKPRKNRAVFFRFSHAVHIELRLNFRLKRFGFLNVRLQIAKFLDETLMESNKADNLKLYQISFEHRPEYLYVYVAGEEDSYEVSIGYWREVAAECKKSNIKKVLIEEDIPEAVEMSDMYRIASEIPLLGFAGVRVAFVDRYTEQQKDNEFGELVATNRGLYGKIFDNTEEAEKWLMGD